MASYATSSLCDQRFDELPNVNVNAVNLRSTSVALGQGRVVWANSVLSRHGMLLERQLYSPGERISTMANKHLISMSHNSPVHFEYRDSSGRLASAVIRPKTLMLTPAGSLPNIHLKSSAEFTHCALPDDFLRHVADEIGHTLRSRQFCPVLKDRSFQRMMDLLLDEHDASLPLGHLYVDSLVYALATRYVLIDNCRTGKTNAPVTGLVPHILNRVRTKIEANLNADLSVDTLAELSGYSRAHFIRLFRLATGLTPHEYVLKFRVRRAQELLKQEHQSIIDVALCCGFSSQSHMTAVFRRHLATTPGEFRRHPAN